MLKKFLSIILLKNVYLNSRFFVLGAIVLLMFMLSFTFPFLLLIAQGTLLAVFTFVLVDLVLLFNGGVVIRAKRIMPADKLSLGAVNTVELKIESDYKLPLDVTIIDELPDVFQRRDFSIEAKLEEGSIFRTSYDLTPKSRGVYTFYNLNVFLKTFLGLVERRIPFDLKQDVLVYPSIKEMKQFELLSLSQIATMQGVKKVRRIGHSYEFDQIRNYVKGDDYRSVNWKATSRRNDLMVNVYEDERSQQIFSVIDKGRSMQMPFGGMSLMDYAINTSLVISSVALHRHDKAGLMTFSDKVGATVKPEQGAKQLNVIIETLFKEEPRSYEANYELLYTATKQFIRRRSLLFLYTNFESYSAMKRVLPLLRRINSMHLLVVVFFENTEIVDYSKEKAASTEEIYYKTIASKFVEEKHRIVQELRQFGIQSILTRPEELSVHTVNKYLELKSRGMI